MAVLAAIRRSHHHQGDRTQEASNTHSESEKEMLITLPTRDCRAAIGKAIEDNDAKLEADRATLAERSYQQLYDGAVHNGLRPSQAQLDEMKAMVDRDLVHAMESHPRMEIKGQLELYAKMALYSDASRITLDARSFELLQSFLPTRVTEEA